MIIREISNSVYLVICSMTKSAYELIMKYQQQLILSIDLIVHMYEHCQLTKIMGLLKAPSSVNDKFLASDESRLIRAKVDNKVRNFISSG